MATANMLSSLFPLFSLVCFISIFCLLSLSKKASISSSSPTYPHFHLVKPTMVTGNIEPNATSGSNPYTSSSSSCDYSDGSWIHDPDVRLDRYDSSCKEIFKGWNCILNKKSNGRDIVKWRWKPRNCHLPPFDPLKFLHTYRVTNIGILTSHEILKLEKVRAKLSCLLVCFCEAN